MFSNTLNFFFSIVIKKTLEFFFASNFSDHFKNVFFFAIFWFHSLTIAHLLLLCVERKIFFFLVCTAHLTSVLLLRSFTTVVVKSSHVDFWLSMLYSIFCVCFFFPLVLKYRKSNCEQHTESPQLYHTLDGGHTMSPDAFAQVENRTGWSEMACDCDGKIKFRFAIFYGMCRFPVSTFVQHTLLSVCSHFICIRCAVLIQICRLEYGQPPGREIYSAWTSQIKQCTHKRTNYIFIFPSTFRHCSQYTRTDKHNCSVCIYAKHLAYRLELEFNCECHFWRFFFTHKFCSFTIMHTVILW